MAGESKDSTTIAAMFNGLLAAKHGGEGHVRHVTTYENQIRERQAQDLHRIALALEAIVALIAKASEQ